METTKTAENKYNTWIIIVSIAIPLAVALLFVVKLKDFGINVKPFSFLPPIYATVNGLTAIVLFSAVMAIKNGRQKLHENLMKTAIALSISFLVMYVAYHMSADSTAFGGEGAIKWVYRFILITHIILSIIIIPFVLVTYVRALAQRFDRHKKLARITYPMWMYVAITGVIVYIMISPYYAH